MNNLDTNILLYATNKDCEEHQSAAELIKRALVQPDRWIVAEQVYLEYYRLLRNPSVLEKPLKAPEAYERIDFFRNKSGWLHCHFEGTGMNDLAEWLKKDDFPAGRTFDLVLAVTLKQNGVKKLYTRNTADFTELEWFDLIDPIASPL